MISNKLAYMSVLFLGAVLYWYLLQMVDSEYPVCFQIYLGWVQSKILHLNLPESFDLDLEFVAWMLCLCRVINE